MASRLNSFLVLVIYSLLVNALHAHNSGGNVGHYIAIEKIQAEDYTFIANALVHDDCPDSNIYFVGDIDSETVIQYDGVDFGGETFASVDFITFYLTNTYTGYSIDVSLHLGNSTNPPFTTLSVPYTEDSCDFIAVDFAFGQSLTGVQNLVFTFPNAPEEGSIQLDWFQFSKGDTPMYNATDIIEFEDYTSIADAGVFDACEDSNNDSVICVAVIDAAAVLQYGLVDFGKEDDDVSVDTISLHLTNVYFGRTIDVSVHLGSSTNPPIANLTIPYTGSDSCDFITLEFALDQPVTGIQDLIFTFAHLPKQSYLYLDWFQFN